MPEAQMITLACPSGAEGYAISHGAAQFIPYREDHKNPASRWLVDVPPEAALGLTHTGGFVMVQPAAAVPHGFALIRHTTDPNAGFSGGAPDGNGNLIIEVGRVADARAHGFVAIDEGTPLAAPKMAPAELEKNLTEAVARIMELEGRLGVAGQAAESLAGERAELNRQLAAVQAGAKAAADELAAVMAENESLRAQLAAAQQPAGEPAAAGEAKAKK